MQKSIADMAKYIKNIIPENIPETYPLKQLFNGIGDDETIRNGVVSFRDFLYLVCDQLIADGSLHDKPSKAANKDAHGVSLPVAYPFLNDVKNVLFNIGYHGILAEDGTSILLGDWQPLTSTISVAGSLMKTKTTVPKVIESLKFLADCGVCFDGIDLNAGKSGLVKAASLEITYPDNPDMLTGLKVMAVAQMELGSWSNQDIFLRCDYRVLKDEETDVTSILKDVVNPLSAKGKAFALNLHQRYLDAGLTCSIDINFLGIRFIYFYKSKEIWTISASPDSGYRILIKAKNTPKYADVIAGFPLPLREKIARGYGCDKKLFGEPCQKGCHGFSFSLDETVLEISRDIETWLDKEVLYSSPDKTQHKKSGMTS